MLALGTIIAKFFLADASCSTSRTFFIIPSWDEYLGQARDNLNQCAPVFHMPGDIWLVALAILDMLLRLAGLLAVVSIIVAGAQYITAAGNAETITNARRRIIYALSGLAIALVATATVAYIGRVFGG